MNEIGVVRRSQVLSSYGPGAIIDFRGVNGEPISVIAAGLDQWDKLSLSQGLSDRQVIHHSRLEKNLRVFGFRLPPIGKDKIGYEYRDRFVPSYRFPTWHFCQNCDILQEAMHWANKTGESGLFCPDCSTSRKTEYVLPVSIMVTCQKGHLDEFPWQHWVNHRDGCPKSEKLRLRTEGVGLKGLTVHCPSCEQSRNLEGALTPSEFQQIGVKCFGRRPWLGSTQNEECDLVPIAVQRGASNVYFPVSSSAIDVPPWGDEFEAKLGEFWSELKENPNFENIEPIIEFKGILKNFPNETVQSLLEKIRKRLDLLQENLDIRCEEYMKLTSDESVDSTEEFYEHKNFKISRQEIPNKFKKHIEHIVVVERLREVRALRGFTRIYPLEGDDTISEIAHLSADPNLKWLPAIEVHGEGIFVGLNEKQLNQWETNEEILNRAEDANKRYIDYWRKRKGEKTNPPISITARFLLIHTISHALVNKLSLESGYSVASIRERLYISRSENMCGFLLYTSSPDSSGTLGGLSREGRTSRIGPLLLSALEDLKWCSSDPLCSDGRIALTSGMGLAACHSCTFVPETTCEQFNCHLDRVMVIGSYHNPKIGYFSEILTDS